ncbi:lytic transglycosylase domain-containing protein [Bradyrhizobium huanghuaihaiense]|uniref:lytic transglycosylase domain-containing protein n=1 Tax=Bradyrhizobium huanghuaihaiense TaxID=990078 RepID=UPI003CC56D41
MSLPSIALVLGLLLLALLFPVDARAEATSAPKTIDARHAAVEAKSEAPPARAPDAGSRYRALIEKEAAQVGLAPEIAEAVMAVESGYDPGAIGGVGEIGLMQILPSTARMLGFAGTLADLAVPETNIHYGVVYLAKAWRLAGGDLCTAAMKYRAGHGETRFSFLSVNYCMAVRSKLAARGFRVTGSIPVPTFGEPVPSGRGCGRKCQGISRTGTVNIAALNTQLSALVAQARAGR